MTDYLWAAQAAVFSKLSGDSGVTALVGSRIYDYAPENAVFPYITLGPAETRDFGTKSTTGQTMTLTLSIWSRYRGFKEAKQILAAVRDALHDTTLTLSSGSAARCQEEFVGVFRDSDNLTTQGAARYRVVVTS